MLLGQNEENRSLSSVWRREKTSGSSETQWVTARSRSPRPPQSPMGYCSIFDLFFHTGCSSVTWVNSELYSISSWNTWKPVWQMLGEQESALATEHGKVALKKYFQRSHLCLGGKKHSECAWEIVTVEIRRAAREAEEAELQGRLRMQSCNHW